MAALFSDICSTTVGKIFDSISSVRAAAKIPKRFQALLLVVVTIVTGCSTSTAINIDAIGADSIAISPLSAAPITDRVVALANGSAEIVYALGAGSALVGRDIASTFPGDLNVPIVTSAHSISAERVLAQQPDLVLIDGRSGPAEAIAQIKSAGVEVRTIPDAWTLSDMSAKVLAIATVLDLKKQGDRLIAQQQGQLAKIKRSAKAVRVAFLYLRGTASIYLLGGKGSGADALIEGIGAVDVGAKAGLKAFTPLTSETVAALNPQVLLVMQKGLESVGGIEGLVTLPGIAQTEAGRQRRIIAVDDSLLLSFGPRTPKLMALLSQRVEDVMQR